MNICMLIVFLLFAFNAGGNVDHTFFLHHSAFYASNVNGAQNQLETSSSSTTTKTTTKNSNSPTTATTTENSRTSTTTENTSTSKTTENSSTSRTTKNPSTSTTTENSSTSKTTENPSTSTTTENSISSTTTTATENSINSTTTTDEIHPPHKIELIPLYLPQKGFQYYLIRVTLPVFLCGLGIISLCTLIIHKRYGLIAAVTRIDEKV